MTMHPDIHADIVKLHETLQVPIKDVPTIPAQDRQTLRVKLIDEEVNEELIPALKSRNLINIADAIVDSIVVIVGTAVEYGIPFNECWNEVQRTNLAKVGLDGKPIFRADGKFLKPEGWQPPDIRTILMQAMELAEDGLRAKEKVDAVAIQAELERISALAHEDQHE